MGKSRVDKVFWTDPYLTELGTEVTGVYGDDVTVERTIFFAFSGGQESDAGTIGGARVLRARTDGQQIVYTLEPGHGLRLGAPVTMAIDWARRHRLMRLHLAAELVLELVYQAHDPIEKIGAHIAEDKARIDFAWDGMLSEVLPDIQAKAAALIAADHPVITAFSDSAAERRYWEIAGFARVPCGGTHLKSTGEIGEIRLKRRNPGKGKERIEITLI